MSAFAFGEFRRGVEDVVARRDLPVSHTLLTDYPGGGRRELARRKITLAQWRRGSSG